MSPAVDASPVGTAIWIRTLPPTPRGPSPNETQSNKMFSLQYNDHILLAFSTRESQILFREKIEKELCRESNSDYYDLMVTIGPLDRQTTAALSLSLYVYVYTYVLYAEAM